MIGTTLGRYRLIEPLGKGGMGEVFLAEDPALGRMVAIKVLPREFALDRERRSRLIHEARAASALNHPNIITVHDLGESNGTLYIAVELVKGDAPAVGAFEARTPAAVLRVIRQATQALAVAHAAGLVHRDLKPDNLMVREDGLLKILDFGLARSPALREARSNRDRARDRHGHRALHVAGASPGADGRPTERRVLARDHSLRALAGTHPFWAESAVETMHRILHETPEPPSRVKPTLPAEVDFVLAKALSKDPNRRHPNARDLDVDLETLEHSYATSHAVDGKKGNGGSARSRSFRSRTSGEIRDELSSASAWRTRSSPCSRIRRT
jgi:serine/threonine protein kinase